MINNRLPLKTKSQRKDKERPRSKTKTRKKVQAHAHRTAPKSLFDTITICGRKLGDIRYSELEGLKAISQAKVKIASALHDLKEQLGERAPMHTVMAITMALMDELDKAALHSPPSSQ